MNGVPLERWNHFENIADRTTNDAEGFHNKLNEAIGKSHLPLRSLLPKLQKEHNLTLSRINQLHGGAQIKQKRQKYVILNERIHFYKAQLEQYLNWTLVQIENAPVQEIDAYILAYMDKMQYLLS